MKLGLGSCPSSSPSGNQVDGSPLVAVAFSATQHGGQEELFADDLNIFHEFDKNVPDATVQLHVNQTRSAVHQWGKRNRVTFDPAKEHTVVIHPILGVGADFRLLGCLVDPQLLMLPTINATLAKARPKVTSLLRMRGFFSSAT